jgi:DNA modification methylase
VTALRSHEDLDRVLEADTYPTPPTAGKALRQLPAGTYTLQQLYREMERLGLDDRPGAREPVQDGQSRYKRDVRNALQQLRRSGSARRVEDGHAAWFIEGTRQRPVRALFVWLQPGAPGQIELILGAAADVLAQTDEPIDLILADPPWALTRNDPQAKRLNRRNHNLVIDGYCEVDRAEYADFTAEWVTAAAKVLRPGGYLAVVTGPEQSARVQTTAEDAGLTYVNSIVAKRQFGTGHPRPRRYAHQHRRITLMTAGPLSSPHRIFHPPPELPVGRNGGAYPVDVWTDIMDKHRRQLLRYDNALPVELASRVIRSTTNPHDFVVDPFLGSGTTAVACLQDGRRFRGGDLNPGSLRFTMGRILSEVVPMIAARLDPGSVT